MSESILDIFEELQIQYKTDGHEHCRAGWAQLDCLFCSPGQQRWRLGANIRGGYLNCWACGSHRLYEFLALSRPSLRHKDLLDLIGRVRGQRAGKEPEAGQAKRQLVLPKGIQPLDHAHRRYLRKRGFDPDEISEVWDVQGIGVAPRLQWRLFIPIMLQDRTVVSWTTRSTTDTHAERYRSASLEEEAVPHKNLLYGAQHALRSTVIVHEGPTDVWATGPGAVATLGTAYSRHQVRALLSWPTRILAFDSEPTAQRRAKKLADELLPFPGETLVVRLESGKDAASISDRERKQLRALLR